MRILFWLFGASLVVLALYAMPVYGYELYVQPQLQGLQAAYQGAASSGDAALTVGR